MTQNCCNFLSFNFWLEFILYYIQLYISVYQAKDVNINELEIHLMPFYFCNFATTRCGVNVWSSNHEYNGFPRIQTNLCKVAFGLKGVSELLLCSILM